MTREEMLNELHSINIGAQATVATMDMGLQYEYVTKEGWGENFGCMGDWPAYALHEISDDLIIALKAKIMTKSLSLADFAGTNLEKFYNYVFNVERPSEYIPSLSDFFEGIIHICSVPNGTLYVLCDARQWEPEAQFFDSYDALAQAFLDQYNYGIQEWEDMDDDELADWIEKIDNELSGISLIEFESNDE